MLASLPIRRTTSTFYLTTAIKVPAISALTPTTGPNSTQPHTKTHSRPPQKDQILSLLQNCTSLNHLNQLHALLLTLGHSTDPFSVAKMVSFCVNLGALYLDHALLIFNLTENPATFLWNTMIRGYSQSLLPNRALSFYIRMLREEAKPNKFTFPPLIKASLQLSQGAQIHCQVLKFVKFQEFDGFLQSSLVYMYANFGNLASARQVFDEMPQMNPVSATAMIDGYVKFGLLEAARQLFDEMTDRDSVCWSSMISGYVHQGKFNEGLSLFSDMQLCRIRPNQSVLVSVLSACANLGALDQGKWVHAYMNTKGIKWNVELCTAMINMYANCGDIETALQIFKTVSPQAQAQRDIGTWNAIISGLAINSRGREAFDLFCEMQNLGLKPDEVTFIAVLNGCSHSALVNEGRYCFHTMCSVYSIAPKIQHYGCLVDLLGRAGFVEEAELVIKNMPIEPDATIWVALLNACRIHGNVELGERVGKHLVSTEPHCDGHYVLLSNLYASFGRWDDALKVRDLMRNQGEAIARMPGCSSVEVNEWHKA